MVNTISTKRQMTNEPSYFSFADTQVPSSINNSGHVAFLGNPINEGKASILDHNGPNTA